LSLIASIETFIVTLPRDEPYLGPIGPGEAVNSRGYVVREGNGTIYPVVDRSIALRITTDNGRVGWGETYGICAPKATCEIVNDLLAPVIIGSDADPVEAIWDRLYGLMRVRGCTGGFHLDAIAAIDIALWDLRARRRGLSIARLLAPSPSETVAGYMSGLPAATLDGRIALAKAAFAAGHRAFKFAAVISHEGVVTEMAALRQALGEDAEIAVDLHWKYSADEALALISALADYRPAFIEAPVKPEDVAGLAQVASRSTVPIAAGEEWYSAYEARNRLDAGSLAFLQPEMGHTGITQFLRIAALSAERGIAIAPHATIGTGLFLAASLQVSATLPNLWKHEWQHSVFERNLALLDGDMGYTGDTYRLPTGPGIGVSPGPRFWDHAEAVA
jgi:L-alanine-DL-glutamate epimerase-like enolase superfamily enzyme